MVNQRFFSISFVRKIDMEGEGCNFRKNKGKDDHHEQEQEKKLEEILKRRISGHPLYGMLLEAHLECLKIGGISNLEGKHRILDYQKRPMDEHNELNFSQSELDVFMEAYCLALGKLKEAMEEPQQKSMAFINGMHSQLVELTKRSHHHSTAEEDDDDATTS